MLFKKRFFVVLLVVSMVVMMMPAMDVGAKSKPKFVTKTKTLTVGKTTTIRLKNANHIKWKSTNNKVLAIIMKMGNKIKVEAVRSGKSIIVATYKHKKYKLTLKVKQKKKAQVKDNPVLNATDIDLYYVSDYEKKYVKDNQSHLKEFRFRVSGTNKKVKSWLLEGEDSKFFNITSYGLVTVQWAPPYEDWTKSATVKAILEDGRALTAKVTLYSELNFYIENKLDEEIAKYIPNDLLPVEKAEKAAWYAGAFSDYESGQNSWVVLLLEGRGDCCASRYLVEKMCKRMGIQACGCYDFDYHGETVIRIDGKYYYSITGFKGTRPREYMFHEMTEEDAQKMFQQRIIFENILVDER